MNKTCTICHKEKSINDFDSYSNMTRSYCKDCRREKDKLKANERRIAKGIKPIKNTIIKCNCCGLDAVRNSINTIYCKLCANNIALERARKSSLEKARLRGNRIIGTVHQCEYCKNDFTLLKPRSIYCNDCKVLQRKGALPKMKEHVKKYKKQYMSIPENKMKALNNSYKYTKNKRLNDPIFAIACRVRSRINESLRKNGYNKNSKTYEILGCSFEFLKGYLEKQFVKGMNWENRSEWHIDHIVPISSAKTEEDVIKLNHYTNLRPLWAKDNLIKSNKAEFLI